jgi:Ni/Fe-hydrogenase b-type cytochrome subunit
MTTRAGAPAPRPRGWKGISLAHKVPPPSGDYHWVYLWEWPVRVMHWLAALSLLILAVTGLYIGRPYFVTSGDTSSHYLMGWVRFLHFAAAAVLVATAIVRGYWLVAGNKYERWIALFPVRPRDWINLVKQVKYYLMIQPEKAPHYLGHNPLQQLSYTAVYGLALLQVITGFALYGQSDPGGFFLQRLWLGRAAVWWNAGRAVRPPRGDLGIPQLHPDPRVPGGTGRPPRAGRRHLLHHQRGQVRALEAEVRR